MRYWITIALTTTLLACGSPADEATTTAVTDTTAPASPVTAEEISARLYGELTADSSRAGRERNAIINFAIDEVIDLQAAPEGFFYQILEPGTGELIEWGDEVRVHYRGRFLDGREFDSTYERNRPLEFYVGNLIPAWNQGLQLLRPGGRMLLVSPSDMAYAAEGLVTPKGNTLVPPHTVLVFELEVLD